MKTKRRKERKINRMKKNTNKKIRMKTKINQRKGRK